MGNSRSSVDRRAFVNDLVVGGGRFTLGEHHSELLLHVYIDAAVHTVVL